MMKKLLSLCLAFVLVIGLVNMAPVARAASDFKASESCIAFIKEFEGFSGKPYRDSDGKYTIGYGTRCPDELVDKYMETPMTQEEADAELREKLVTYENAVNAFIDRNGLTYEQRQFDALISLVFNCGTSWLSKGSTLVRALVSGAEGNELIYAFSIYSMSGGTRSVGHVRRRLAEANVYLNGQYSRTAPDNFAYVLYNAQGGTIVASGGSYNVQGYDAALTAAPIATAVREGYVFLGWYTAASGGQNITVLDMTTRNATLYAHWAEDDGTGTPIDPTEPEIPTEPGMKPVTVTVTGSVVNLRAGAGLSFDVVGSALKGDELTITETVSADDYLWGKTEIGWIALKHTDYVPAEDVTEPTEPTEPSVVPTEPSQAPTEPESCAHSYVVSFKQEPSCTVGGRTTYTCTLCGHSYTSYFGATGHNYAAATCTAPKTCKTCGETSGYAVGHSYEDPTCTKSQVCKICGKTSGEALGHSFEPATCTKPQTCKNCGFTSGSALSHKYSPATCTTPATCNGCGQTTGQALGHSYQAATCTEPSVCQRCGDVKGEALGHNYADATCTAPKTCKTCGHKAGEALGHNFDAAACSKPATCKVCGYQSGAALGHNYQPATCDKPRICKVCGAVTGSALGHDYADASCTAPKTCKTCGLTEGTALAHSYGNNGLCTACGAKDPDYKAPTTEITKTYGTVIKTDSLNIRVTPDGAICGSLKLGQRVEILEQKMVGDRLWGRCTQGWICMRSYVSLETVTETIPNDTTPAPEVTTKTFGTIVRTDTLNIRQTPDGTVVGVLYLGDRVEILEQKMVAGRMWGRFAKGWICLRSYVELEVVTENDDTHSAPVEPPVTEPQKPTTVEKTYGTVINTNSLNVRLEPDGEIVTKLYRGDRVEILEQKMSGGRLWGLCEQGWICMRSYVSLETVTETLGGEKPQEPQEPDQKPEKDPAETVVKTYATVIVTDSLNIRVTPDGTVCGALPLGERVEVLEQKFVSGRLWGRMEQGWICMRSYVKLETVTESLGGSTATQETGMITASCLNIRSAAGTGNAIVGQLFKGATVVILEKTTVDGTTWARIDQGWISMAYVA